MTTYFTEDFTGGNGTQPDAWSISTGTQCVCNIQNNELRFFIDSDGSSTQEITSELTDYQAPTTHNWSVSFEFNITGREPGTAFNRIIELRVDQASGGSASASVYIRPNGSTYSLVTTGVGQTTNIVEFNPAIGKLRIDHKDGDAILGVEEGGEFKFGTGDPITYAGYMTEPLYKFYIYSRVWSGEALSQTINVDNFTVQDIPEAVIEGFWTNPINHKESLAVAGNLTKTQTLTFVPAVAGQTYIPPTEYVPPQTVVEYKTEKTCKKVG